MKSRLSEFLTGISIDYGLDDRPGFNSRQGAATWLFSSRQLPDWLWSPHSFLFNRYRQILPRG